MLRRSRPSALLPGHAASRAVKARQWLTRSFAGRAVLTGPALKLQRAASPAVIEEMIQRRQAGASTRYPGVSYTVVPVRRSCSGATSPGVHDLRPVAPLVAGPWMHIDPPRALPDWVPCSGQA